MPPADKKDIEGKIAEMIDDTRRFLRLYLKEEHQIKGFESELKPELPEAALREAIVNAVAHRDYTISAPIRLLVFQDRLEIRTPGRLPNTVTIERVKMGGAHVLRNPTVYNLLAKMGLVTDVGSGVRRIIKTVSEHLNKEVLLEETESEFILIIPRKS
jgi:ATP-dependent DNA helicase RecG